MGRTIAGQSDLAVGVPQFVEDMEETFLSGLFAADKLDIIDQQHIRIAVFIAEFLGFPLADSRIDKLVGKLLGTDIITRMPFVSCGIADGIQKMGLAQPYPAVDIKRIITARSRLFRGAAGSGKSQAVAVADHKGIKGIFRIQPGQIARCGTLQPVK